MMANAIDPGGLVRSRDRDTHPLILLGAGASVEAGVPAARPIVTELLDFVRDDSNGIRILRETLDFVWATLGENYDKAIQRVRAANAIQSSWRQRQEPDPPDIESLLNAVDRLAARSSDPLSAFVASWHPRFADKVLRPRGLFDCRAALERALVKRVWLRDSSRIGYLRPLVARATMENPVTVATLNYDNCIELTARAESKVVSYGLEREDLGIDASFEVSGAAVRLLKLHGSANWRRIDGGVLAHRDAPIPRHVTALSDDEVGSWSMGSRLLIFGQAQKLSADYPFFDLYLAFRDALFHASEVFVAGYSFRGAHINAALSAWFGRAGSRTLTIVDAFWDADAERRFRRALRLPPPNEPADRLRIIRLKASDGIAAYLDSAG